jgi:uncharacterized protein (DUF433 family)
MAADRDAAVLDPEHPRIVADDLFGGEPRIRERRITVLDVYEGVQEGSGDLPPGEFAETFELSVADVYHALAYYHSHREEMERQRETRARASEELREQVEQERPAGIDPPN